MAGNESAQAARARLKAEVETIGKEHGHTLGPWLDLPHAAQLGCLACDRWAFVELLPPPGRVHVEALAADCPHRGKTDVLPVEEQG